MKTINNRFFLFGLAMIVACFAGSCDNDDQTPVVEPATDYAGIQLQHIKALESEMTSAEIQASNASEILFNEGDVFVYLSSEGNYGKFKILKIDTADNFKLTIEISNFNVDGSILLATNSLTVRGSYLCDLDIVAETSETPTDDFHWNRLTKWDTRFCPKNGAKFTKFVFKS